MLPFHFLNWTRKKLFSFAHPLDEQKIIISLSALMRQSLKSVSNTGVPSDFTGIPRKHFQWWYIIISWKLAVLYLFTLSKELNYIYEFKMGFCFQSTKKKITQDKFLVKGLEGISCGEQLRDLGLSSLGMRMLREDLIAPEASWEGQMEREILWSSWDPEDTWERFSAVPREACTGHWKAFLYWECDQTLQQSS